MKYKIDKSDIRNSLSSNIESLDDYLLDISYRYPNHKFLSGATQGIYIRLVKTLKFIALSSDINPSDLKVLDWGSGKGHISYLLQKEGFNVTSCDLVTDSDDSSFGQDTPIINDNNIDIISLEHEFLLPFDDSTFDIVVSFGVLEHVSKDQESLIEINRVLKKEGMFFFNFLPYWLSWTQNIAHMRGDWYHDRLYKKSQVHKMSKNANFDVAFLDHCQLFPKNILAHSNKLEKIDRILTQFTPLKYLSTNLEGILIAK